jgi:predicted kinase
MSDQKLCIYVFFGMIASGKSTLAAAWARQLGIASYNSDVERKKLVGLAPSSRRAEGFESGIYSRAFSRKTYDALLAAAELSLRAGRSVILDASYGKKEERDRVRQLAACFDATARFILCRCPEKETRRRLARRAMDPAAVSDGRWEIYLHQKATFEAPVELAGDELFTIDTSEAPQRLVKRLEVLHDFG